ncbi:hypothetical protein GGI00_006303 [Coemansia sp. RSA 2681]|nr:hypothetical protein GGI00_006303 [Coemansia sp. RSA 2681]
MATLSEPSARGLDLVVAIRIGDDELLSLEVREEGNVLALKIEQDSGGTIELSVYYRAETGTASMCRLFTYQPQQHLMPIHFVIEGRSACVRKMCMDPWLDNADVLIYSAGAMDARQQLSSDSVTMLKFRDKGSSDVAIARLVSTPARRGAELLINLYCQSEKTATAELVLLYWGAFIDIDRTFEYAQDWRFTIQLAAAAIDVAALKAKKWFDLDIEFHLGSGYHF